MSGYSLKIVCRAKSHEGKEAIVGRLSQDRFDEGLAKGTTLLIDDRPVSSKDVYGGVNSPPDGQTSATFSEKGRKRDSFVCPLCGLDVQMRDESLRALMNGLIKSGAWKERRTEVLPGEFWTERVASIGLEALAASM